MADLPLPPDGLVGGPLGPPADPLVIAAPVGPAGQVGPLVVAAPLRQQPRTVAEVTAALQMMALTETHLSAKLKDTVKLPGNLDAADGSAFTSVFKFVHDVLPSLAATAARLQLGDDIVIELLEQ